MPKTTYARSIYLKNTVFKINIDKVNNKVQSEVLFFHPEKMRFTLQTLAFLFFIFGFSTVGSIPYSLSENIEHSAASFQDEVLYPHSIERELNYDESRKTQCHVPATIPVALTDIFAEATKDIPCHLLQTLYRVEIFEDNTGTYPRAMANARIIKVRKDAIDDPEMVNVLIHELGHVVDLGGLESKDFQYVSRYKDGAKVFYEDDPSLLFYEISWTPSGKKMDMNSLDFAGGYGSTDMFEDFAECFLLYQKHGNYFKQLAISNESMRKKYEFFKEHVFEGKEFSTGLTYPDISIRYWDITRI